MARTSRPQRWRDAVAELQQAFDDMQNAAESYNNAAQALSEVREEYQEWYDNLNEGLQAGPTGQMLEELLSFETEVEVDLSEYEELVNQAESAELPRGFGRD